MLHFFFGVICFFFIARVCCPFFVNFKIACIEMQLLLIVCMVSRFNVVVAKYFNLFPSFLPSFLRTSFRVSVADFRNPITLYYHSLLDYTFISRFNDSYFLFLPAILDHSLDATIIENWLPGRIYKSKAIF